MLIAIRHNPHHHHHHRPTRARQSHHRNVRHLFHACRGALLSLAAVDTNAAPTKRKLTPVAVAAAAAAAGGRGKCRVYLGDTPLRVDRT